MAAPPRFAEKLAHKLFADGEERAAFLAALDPQGKRSPFASCVLWRGDRPDPLPFERLPPLPWQPPFVDRLADPLARPGAHPLHGAGEFYCLDFSSVFAASILGAIAGPVETVVDVCAAPGGKSVFAWRSLRPDVLIANEAIGKRVPALLSNLRRCRIGPAAVTRCDPQTLAPRLAKVADVVLVDAPCSGQSLLAKGETNPGCFHPVNVNKNANRQKRILAHAAAIAAPGGYLAYTTCTYAIEENEGVCQWLCDRIGGFEPVPVPSLAMFQSPLTDWPCYRMGPQSGLGAGAFAMLLRRTDRGDRAPLPPEFGAIATIAAP
ncbi:MAG: RsmB/NOP family class I SAM-dependent RNA methyltransferase [Cyanobacteria bacterium]|nr:RsmB/NOP family class I SAM-dependent RNA methyltransferase [Cyanobacteriota bacterium]